MSTVSILKSLGVSDEAIAKKDLNNLSDLEKFGYTNNDKPRRADIEQKWLKISKTIVDRKAKWDQYMAAKNNLLKKADNNWK